MSKRAPEGAATAALLLAASAPPAAPALAAVEDAIVPTSGPTRDRTPSAVDGNVEEAVLAMPPGRALCESLREMDADDEFAKVVLQQFQQCFKESLGRDIALGLHGKMEGSLDTYNASGSWDMMLTDTSISLDKGRTVVSIPDVRVIGTDLPKPRKSRKRSGAAFQDLV